MNDQPTQYDADASGGPKGELFIVGAGGHAKVVIDVARSAGWQVVAAFDPGGGAHVLDVPILGDDDAIANYISKTGVTQAAIGIGDNRLRHKLANKVRAYGGQLPCLIHERAWISPFAALADGTVVMAGAVVQANAEIARDCIINTMAIVEHDCYVGDAAHIAPRSVMGGSCSVGAYTLFGIGAIARPEITIGQHSIIGAGSVVVSDIPSEKTVFGNPAR